MAGYKQQESFTSPKRVQSILLFFQRLFSSVPSNVCIKKHVVPRLVYSLVGVPLGPNSDLFGSSGQ